LLNIFADLFHHILITAISMWQEARCAIFDAFADYFEITAAFIAQKIEWAIAKHAVEAFLADIRMAWKKCAGCVFEVFITVRLGHWVSSVW